jgi:hypothetical protein
MRVALLAAVLLLETGCAGLDSDVHLAPLWTQASTADGRIEREALGGMYLERRFRATEELEVRALKPLLAWRQVGPEEQKTEFLAPLGYWRVKADSEWGLFLPIFYWRAAPVDWAAEAKGEPLPEGAPAREIDLLLLPGLIWSKNARGANKVGFFPIYGELDKFLTWDRVRFVFFPLYVSARRGDSTMHNVLFPVFGWKRGGSGSHWRVWPIVGRNSKPNHHERWFVLWPIFHWHVEGLWKEPANRRRSFAILPLYGRTAVGTYRAHSFLWPFFGYAYDPRGGAASAGDESANDAGAQASDGATRPFWAWDGPWPLVRLQGGGLDPAAQKRTRVWPFYSHFEGDGLEWDSYAWPLVHRRREDTPGYSRASFYVLPIYQSWRLERPADSGAARVETWQRVWPLWRSERRDSWRRHATLSLDPLMRSSVIDFHYGWLWELMAWESDGPVQRERAWLGLYRRESTGAETRWSFSGLWSERSFESGTGRVSETSLLFGLLRWRSGPKDSDPGLLRPAFPGPGWPREFAPPAR